MSDLVLVPPLAVLAAADVYLTYLVRRGQSTEQRLRAELDRRDDGATVRQPSAEAEALRAQHEAELREYQQRLEDLQRQHHQLLERKLSDVSLNSRRLLLVGAVASGKSALCASWCGRDPAAVQRSHVIDKLFKSIDLKNLGVEKSGVALREHQCIECYDMPGEVTIDAVLQALRESEQNLQDTPRALLFVIALWPYPGPGPGLSEGEVMKQVEENLKSQWKSFEFDLQVLGKSKVLSKNLKATAIFFNKLDLVEQYGPHLRSQVTPLIEPFVAAVRRLFPDAGHFVGSALTGEQCPGLLRYFVEKTFA